MSTMRFRHIGALVATLALALMVTACGSSKAGGSGGAKSSAKSATANVAAANALLAPYTGHPSPFPVSAPLKKRLPASTTMTYMQCSTPVCQLQWPIAEGAAKTLGIHLNRIKVGSSAQDVTNAFNTLVTEHPDAAIITPIDPALYANQLKSLEKEHVAVAVAGIMNAAQYGIKAVDLGKTTIALFGRLLAAKAVSEKGSKANVVFYSVPELSFVPVLQQSFSQEMKKLCPSCTARIVDIPIATIGSTAPSTMAADLEAHPGTNVAVFSTSEMAEGAPSAFRNAGIHGLIDYGFGPTPVNLQYLKEGEETAELGLDVGVSVWTLVDEAARELDGQALSSAEATGNPAAPDTQFLTKASITFNPAMGWTGYPDFASRFAKLWAGK